MKIGVPRRSLPGFKAIRTRRVPQQIEKDGPKSDKARPEGKKVYATKISNSAKGINVRAITKMSKR